MLRLQGGDGGPCTASPLHPGCGSEEGAHGGDGRIDQEVVRNGVRGEGFSARLGMGRVLEEAEEEATVKGRWGGACGGG